MKQSHNGARCHQSPSLGTAAYAKSRFDHPTAFFTAIAHSAGINRAKVFKIITPGAAGLKTFWTIARNEVCCFDGQMAMATSYPGVCVSHEDELLMLAGSHRAFHPQKRLARGARVVHLLSALRVWGMGLAARTPTTAGSREIITAVDMNELADDVAGIVCGEEHDNVCDVLGLGEPTHWELPCQLGQPLFGVT